MQIMSAVGYKFESSSRKIVFIIREAKIPEKVSV